MFLRRKTKPRPKSDGQALSETAEPPPEEPESEGTGSDSEGFAPSEAEATRGKSLSGGFFSRLRTGLGKTKSALLSPLRALGGREVDDKLLEEVEEILIQADCGVEATRSLIDEIRQVVERRGIESAEDLILPLREAMRTRLRHRQARWTDRAEKPLVILVLGVNGVGKTTSIGKIAKWLRDEGNSVMLVAADTFRAAAIEQLEIWAGRTGSDFVAQDRGSDPGSVCYDALERATGQGTEVVLIDTAGRLHTKANLMEELKKVVRVIRKVIPEAPHETLLVLDATTGQNAIQQARVFHKACDLTGLVMAKLDGTAKGGMILGVGDALDVPIALVGVGEGPDDLRPFDADQFIEALFENGE
jgi:fused signal recognition particle receptor